MFIKKYMEKKFTKRLPKEFNKFREIFQKIVCNWTLGLYYHLWYNIKVTGLENIPKNKQFIVASNHLSGKDPFMIVQNLHIPIAYMAKEELFATFWSRLLMDTQGAFAVNRDKLDVSTIKTVLGLKQTNWNFGIFPQGTRNQSDKIGEITKGFISLAKSLKWDILPVGIIGANQKSSPFNKKTIIINVGELIPLTDNLNSVVEQWCSAVAKLANLRSEYEMR